MSRRKSSILDLVGKEHFLKLDHIQANRQDKKGKIKIYVDDLKQKIEKENKLLVENMPFRKSIDISPLNQFETNLTDKNFMRKKSVNLQQKNEDSSVINFSKSKPNNEKNEFISLKDNYENDDFKKLNNVFDSFDDGDKIFEETSFIVLSLHSNFKLFWDIYMYLIIIYSIFISSFILAFEKDYVELNGYFLFEVVIDISWILDFFLSLITSYIDHEGKIINDLFKIMFKYFNTWLFSDLIVSYPSNLIYLFQMISNKKKIIIETNFYYKLYKIVKRMRIFRFFNFRKSQKMQQFLNHFTMSNDSAIQRTIVFSIIILFLVHASSCIWIYIGLNGDKLTNWIISSNLSSSNSLETYIASLYFHIVTVYTVGYGDIIANNTREKMYMIVFLNIGVFLFSFLVSCISMIFFRISDKKSSQKKKIELLNSIDKEFKLPYKLLRKINKTIKYQYKSSKVEKYQMIDDLPSNFKNQLNMILNRKFIKNLAFFKNKSNQFILFVLPLLKPIITKKGDILFSAGEFVEEIYFVKEGKLSLHLDDDFNQLEVAEINENYHFGEILMFTNEKSPYFLKVKSKISEIFVIKKSDFSKIKSDFHDVIRNVLCESFRMLKLIDKRRKLITLLHEYETNISSLKNKINRIGYFLLNRDFEKYYLHNKHFQDAFDYLYRKNENEIKELLFNGREVEEVMMEQIRRKGNIILNKKVSHKFSKKPTKKLKSKASHSLNVLTKNENNENSLNKFENKTLFICNENYFSIIPFFSTEKGIERIHNYYNLEESERRKKNENSIPIINPLMMLGDDHKDRFSSDEIMRLFSGPKNIIDQLFKKKDPQKNLSPNKERKTIFSKSKKLNNLAEEREKLEQIEVLSFGDTKKNEENKILSSDLIKKNIEDHCNKLDTFLKKIEGYKT